MPSPFQRETWKYMVLSKQLHMHVYIQCLCEFHNILTCMRPARHASPYGGITDKWTGVMRPDAQRVGPALRQAWHWLLQGGCGRAAFVFGCPVTNRKSRCARHTQKHFPPLLPERARCRPPVALLLPALTPLFFLYAHSLTWPLIHTFHVISWVLSDNDIPLSTLPHVGYYLNDLICRDSSWS